MKRVGTQAMDTSKDKDRTSPQKLKHSSFKGGLNFERPLRNAKRDVELSMKRTSR